MVLSASFWTKATSIIDCFELFIEKQVIWSLAP